MQKMTNDEDSVLCVDVGNTNVRFGLLSEMKVINSWSLLTEDLIANPEEFICLLPRKVEATAFCSVVPAADKIVKNALRTITGNPFRLTHDNCGNLPISYPNPEIIGQDRLANSLAAQKLYGTPAIVIDIGTAATFDIVSSEGGYEGGVIVPGPQVFIECLTQKAALIQNVKLPESPLNEAIGRSTSEAMALGLFYGFPAMIQGILEEVIVSLGVIEDRKSEVILTGGGAFRVGKIVTKHDPDLTLKGIALALQEQGFT
jgi:type III pantothenate kinase